ncbi:MAG: hypothetical protein JXA36_03360 [Coriobacteriia bacterium]|nr:hypothetical protein [Coriobacteriia bacterium]
MVREQIIEYHLVTPAFLGGAGQRAETLRIPSFKGVLRFWWRAMVWAELRTDCASDEVALSALHEREARIFGAAAGDHQRQSSVLLALTEIRLDAHAQVGNSLGLKYLRGQGLVSRSALGTGTFAVRMVGKGELSKNDWQSALDAAELAGLVGGLGSASRSGWGSIAISTGDPESRLDAGLTRLAEKYHWAALAAEPPFTAFSALSRIDVSVPAAPDALQALEVVGQQQMLYRHGATDAPRGSKPFSDDARIAAGVIKGSRPETMPARAVFGLPHSYFFDGKRVSFDAGGTRRGRRASPLFTHVHRETDTYYAVQAVLPSRFLPGGDKVVTKPGSFPTSPTPNWAVIHGYLDSFGQRQTVLAPSGGVDG